MVNEYGPQRTWEVDAAQDRVLLHRGVLTVLGAPGTGKTSTLIRAVHQRIHTGGVDPDRVLVLGPTRTAAARLRTQIGAGLGQTFTQPMARTPSSLAFAILRVAAARAELPLPRLLSGAEQDVVLRELLAGHADTGSGPDWPDHLRPALAARGFRAQLRDLLMRTVEHGLEPRDLAELGHIHERPEWAAAAQMLQEYDEVTALSDPGSYDPAWICTAAADILEEDPELLDHVRAQIAVVIVDDAHELTASAARLVQVLHTPGRDALLAGDPDTTVLGFRGAVPGLFLTVANAMHQADPRVGSESAPLAVLGTRYRGDRVLGEVSDRVAERIGVTGASGQGAAHRRPAPLAQPVIPGAKEAPGDRARSVEPTEINPGSVLVGVTRSAAQQARFVAQWLREQHLLHGVGWDELVVIARSRSQQDLVRRALAVGGVPVRMDRAGTPLGVDPAVAPLMLAFEVVTQPSSDARLHLSPDQAITLLSSPIGGVDPVGLRRLRRRLRAQEIAAGGTRSSDEVLASYVAKRDLLPASPEQIPVDLAPLVRVADMLAQGFSVAQRGGNAEEVLWALWDATGLSAMWTRQALGGGPLGARADRDLDAVMVLFGTAENYVERLPGARPHGFLAQVSAAEVAADNLVAGARTGAAVEVLTPQAAAGRQWTAVAVVGVQEGVWPDLRLRDSLLGAEALVAALAGRPIDGPESLRAAQRQVRADELRQFHVAISRARWKLLVTAVASTEEQPSGFLDLVDPQYRERDPLQPDPTMTLRGLVGELRRQAVAAQRSGDRQHRDMAVSALLQLERAGVGGVDPQSWWDTRGVSVDRPLNAAGAPVRVSPSRLQTFYECPLRWFLTSRGADTGQALRAEVGTLVHEIAAAAPTGGLAELGAELDRRWPELGLPSGWPNQAEQEKAQGMLQRYCTYVEHAAAQGRELLGTEIPLAVELPPESEGEHPVVISGTVDRLERTTEGDLLVTDLKTSSTKPPRDKIGEHAQLGAYQVAVEGGAFAVQAPGAGSAGAQLAHLGASGPITQEQPPLSRADDPQWAHTLVRRAGQEMARPTFLAIRQENRVCNRCPARFSCPLQVEGGER